MLDIDQLPLKELQNQCIKELRVFNTRVALALGELSLEESDRPFLIELWKMARTVESNFDYWRRELHELKNENKRLLEYLSTGDEKIIKSLISTIQKRNKLRNKIIETLP